MYARTVPGPEKQFLCEFLDEPDTPLTFECPPPPPGQACYQGVDGSVYVIDEMLSGVDSTENL